MALFNNVSPVLLLLLAVSSIANARFIEVSSESESTGIFASPDDEKLSLWLLVFSNC